jgi:hypothetical protein
MWLTKSNLFLLLRSITYLVNLQETLKNNYFPKLCINVSLNMKNLNYIVCKIVFRSSKEIIALNWFSFIHKTYLIQF